jgi:UDP-3-O-[3-hydroxymyristoyl] glucosamine N-acyltransferase
LRLPVIHLALTWAVDVPRKHGLSRLYNSSLFMTFEIAATELVSASGVPRRLRCRGLRLSELARRHGLSLDGTDAEIGRFAPLSGLGDANDGTAVSYLSSARFASLLRAGTDIAVIARASLRSHLKDGNAALIVPEGSEIDPHDWFYTALAGAIEHGNYERLAGHLSSAAKIHPGATVSENVHVEDEAVIGAGAVILPNTYIGAGAVIKPNATVGGDGFENAVINGKRRIVPHAGGVWLAEGVNVGSSTCVDRGLFGDFTYVGAFTNIDNLVHYAHSAHCGKNCSIVACAEVSGSCVLGDGVWLGPNVSVNQGLSIGDHCYVGTAAVVTKNLPAHSLAYGSPAKPMAQVCVCRAKLQFENGVATCGTCGKTYRLDERGQVLHV